MKRNYPTFSEYMLFSVIHHCQIIAACIDIIQRYLSHCSSGHFSQAVVFIVKEKTNSQKNFINIL